METIITSIVPVAKLVIASLLLAGCGEIAIAALYLALTTSHPPHTALEEKPKLYAGNFFKKSFVVLFLFSLVANWTAVNFGGMKMTW